MVLFLFSFTTPLNLTIPRADFHLSAAFHTPPSFPRIYLEPNTPSLPTALLEQAAFTSPTSLLHLSLASVECFNIFYRLHRLGIAISEDWIGKVDRVTLSDLLYEVEYSVLSVPDSFSTAHERDRDPNSQSETAAHAASIVQALLAAAQIFIFAALRDVPVNTNIFSILLERLRGAITRSPTENWKQERNVNMLLWTLVVACCVAGQRDREWWAGQLGDVMEEMRVMRKEELEGIVKGVAWVEGWGGGLEKVWEDVVDRRRMRMVEGEAREESWEGRTGEGAGGEWYV